MEGHHDETGSYSWEDDPTAGIIPRALHHIFTKLENEKPEDYSVRASYVELYNEQIFDLLSASEQSLRVFDNKDKVHYSLLHLFKFPRACWLLEWKTCLSVTEVKSILCWRKELNDERPQVLSWTLPPVALIRSSL